MMKIISKFCDQIWLYIVYAMGLSMAILLIMKWSDWDTPQKLVCMLAIAIPIHVFEENTSRLQHQTGSLVPLQSLIV